jgi:GT2 family glycosyltransferase
MVRTDAIDVLICTLDRGVAAAGVARQALAQLGPDDAVLILDQSDDGGALAARVAAIGDPRLTLARGPRRGLPEARNRALASTSRPLVVFFDDDVTLSPGCLPAHRAAFGDPQVAGTVGRTIERPPAWNAAPGTCRVGRGGRVRVHLDGSDARDVESLKGCNMGLRRAAVDAVGAFDPGYKGTSFLEETDVSERLRRAGHRLRFVPAAAVTHHRAPAGGVRAGDAASVERWRFHNTGRFLMRNRGPGAVAVAGPVFLAIAVHRALRWGSPRAAFALPAAFVAGAAGAAVTPPTRR